MKAYHEKLMLSKENDTPKPPIPNYVGECVLLICTKLSYKPNFMNYSYRDDMIADGIENCIASVDNFNPAKSINPFAYFTQIAWNAFLRRIAKEKKQTYIKHKNFENQYTNEEMAAIFHDRVGTGNHTNEYSSEVIRSFEEKELLTKQKKKNKLEELIIVNEVETRDEPEA
jgi:DNA-directed RNA polymerase specialized sigma24 family protein